MRLSRLLALARAAVALCAVCVLFAGPALAGSITPPPVGDDDDTGDILDDVVDFEDEDNDGVGASGEIDAQGSDNSVDVDLVCTTEEFGFNESGFSLESRRPDRVRFAPFRTNLDQTARTNNVQLTALFPVLDVGVSASFECESATSRNTVRTRGAGLARLVQTFRNCTTSDERFTEEVAAALKENCDIEGLTLTIEGTTIRFLRFQTVTEVQPVEPNGF